MENNGTLGFIHLKEAWYGESCLEYADYQDCVTICNFAPGGGVFSGFQIKWYGGSPALEMFSDCWSRRSYYTSVLNAMDIMDEDITPELFCAKLLELGLEDRTERTYGES